MANDSLPASTELTIPEGLSQTALVNQDYLYFGSKRLDVIAVVPCEHEDMG